MNRKHFLSSVIGAGALLPGIKALAGLSRKAADQHPAIPPYLAPGDTIGITCPAGYIMLRDIQPAIQLMQSWGFSIKIGDTVGKRDFSFGGSDADRIKDLQEMLDDPEVKAIMCARGGYGAIRLVDGLDFTRFASKPKWVIGFSDITTLHCHIHNNYGIASIHSKMCNSFPDDWLKADPIQADTILSIRKALSGEKMNYTAMPSAFNRQGIASGILIGGNCKTIETMAGSSSDIDTAGKILFLEDTGEYLYSVDRMFWTLKRAGKLSKLAALIVGGFKVKADDPGEEFGRALQDLVLEKIKDKNYPVCFDFPVGHQKNNYALKCGIRHELRVSSDIVSLTEIN